MAPLAYCMAGGRDFERQGHRWMGALFQAAGGSKIGGVMMKMLGEGNL